MNSDYETTWASLYGEIGSVLSQFGVEDATGGDYWIVDRPYGYDQHNVNISNLKMLDPEVVYSLQEILKKFPGWEIFITVYVPSSARERWPDMGLIIREHEIIDGLQRQYFPPEYQSVQYEGSRVGTDKD
jgi:hypothetical protein